MNESVCPLWISLFSRYDALKHAAVVHADFLPPLAHDHGEHHEGHASSDETSSPAHIDFSTLPPRHLTLLLSAPENVLGAVSVQIPAFSSPFAAYAWLLARDYPPPVQTILSSPFAPRSPPYGA